MHGHLNVKNYMNHRYCDWLPRRLTRSNENSPNLVRLQYMLTPSPRLVWGWSQWLLDCTEKCCSARSLSLLPYALSDQRGLFKNHTRKPRITSAP